MAISEVCRFYVTKGKRLDSLISLFIALSGVLIATSIVNIGNSGISFYYLAFIIPLLSVVRPNNILQKLSRDGRITKLIILSLLLSFSLIAITFIQAAMAMQPLAKEMVHGFSRVAFILYFITCLIFIKGRRVEITFRWLRRFLIIVSLYGIYQLPAKIFGLPLFLDWLRNNPSFSYYKFDTAGWIGMMRSTSVFAEPSQATIPLVVFFILNCICKSGPFSRWSGWIVLILFSALTFSRTAWIALLICSITGAVVKATKNRKKIKSKKILSYACVILLSILLPAWALWGYKKGDDASTQIRSESILVAIKAISYYPIIGAGWESFSSVAPRFEMDLPGDFNLDFVHNMFLSYMQQIGILGFLLALYPFCLIIGWSSAPNWIVYSTLLSFLFSAEGGGDIAYASLMWLWIALLINYRDISHLSSSSCSAS